MLRSFLSFKISASPLGIQKGTAFAKFCGAIWLHALTFQSMKMLLLNNQSSKSIKTIALFITVLTLSYGLAWQVMQKLCMKKTAPNAMGPMAKAKPKWAKNWEPKIILTRKSRKP